MILKKTAAAAAACMLALSASLCAHAATTQSGNAVEFDSAADCRIAAMYNENGEFVGAQKFSEKLGFIDYSKLARNADGECKVKIFSWDSASLEPKADVIEDSGISVISPYSIRTSGYTTTSDLPTKAEAAAASIASYGPIYCTDGKNVTAYNLADGINTNNTAKLYINGVQAEWNKTNILNHITGYGMENIALTDEVGSDGYYDSIYVTAHAYAYVSEINSNGSLSVDVHEYGNDYHMVLESEADQNKYGFTYNIALKGKPMAFSDLREGDVLRMDYDRNRYSSALSSKVIDIDVIRKSVTGKCINFDEQNRLYTIFRGASSQEYSYLYDLCDMMVGSEVTLYLDEYGRIVWHDHISYWRKIAVLEEAEWSDAEEQYYAVIKLFTGETLTYPVEDFETISKLGSIVYKDGFGGSHAKNDVNERVINYKINSNGYISAYDSIPESNVQTGIFRYNRIGSVAVKKTTKILAAEISENGCSLTAVKPEQLSGEQPYTAYGIGKLCDDTYEYVLLIPNKTIYTDETPTAVVIKAYKDTDKNGNECDAVTLFYNGMKQSFILGSDVTAENLNRGDVVVFTSDDDRAITHMDVVARMQLCSGTDRFRYEDRGAVVPETPKDWDQSLTPYTEVELAYGRIVDKTSQDFTLVPADMSVTTYDDEMYFDIMDDTKVYVYDYTNTDKTALYVGGRSDITKTLVPSDARDYDTDGIDWTHSALEWRVNYAFVKSIYGEAKEVFVIIAPGKANY